MTIPLASKLLEKDSACGPSADIVTCDPNAKGLGRIDFTERPFDYRHVVALVGDEATVKRYYEDGDAIRLMPENEAFQPILVTRGNDDFRIAGQGYLPAFFHTRPCCNTAYIRVLDDRKNRISLSQPFACNPQSDVPAADDQSRRHVRHSEINRHNHYKIPAFMAPFGCFLEFLESNGFHFLVC